VELSLMLATMSVITADVSLLELAFM
jgi:hypothetical protein